uniref:Uncharacterized protein n=1 Tax=Arundo donax TaxID=35708 RepID=A0A0A9ETP1_ARUDO
MLPKAHPLVNFADHAMMSLMISKTLMRYGHLVQQDFVPYLICLRHHLALFFERFKP